MEFKLNKIQRINTIRLCIYSIITYISFIINGYEDPLLRE